MAHVLTIRRLPETVQLALRRRAAAAGRSMEAEARAILTEACASRSVGADWAAGLLERARARTGDAPQTDAVELIREGRNARG